MWSATLGQTLVAHACNGPSSGCHSNKGQAGKKLRANLGLFGHLRNNLLGGALLALGSFVPEFLLLSDPWRNVRLLPSLCFELVNDFLSLPFQTKICIPGPCFYKYIPLEMLMEDLLELCQIVPFSLMRAPNSSHACCFWWDRIVLRF